MAKLLSVKEAAQELGVNRQRVTALIHAGQLKAVKIGSYWAIDAQSVQARKDAAPKAGRPKT